jgi:hypothetical protein
MKVRMKMQILIRHSGGQIPSGAASFARWQKLDRDSSGPGGEIGRKF